MQIKYRLKKIAFTLIASAVFMLFSTMSLAETRVPKHEINAAFSTLPGFQVLIIEDQLSALTYEAIEQALPNGLTSTSRVNFESEDITYWLIFDLHNTTKTDTDVIIHFDEIFMSQTTLYYLSQGQVVAEKSGLQVPMKERAIQNKTPAFRVTLPANETKRFTVSLNSKLSNYIGLHVDSLSSYHSNEVKMSSVNWFYIGALLSIVIYNMFLYISLKDYSYLMYVGYGVSFVWFVLMYNGYSLYLFSGELAYYWQHGSLSLVITFLAQFSRSLLKTRKWAPKTDTALNVLSVISLVFALLFFIDISFYRIFLLVAALSAGGFIAVGILALINNIEIARYYLLAASVYMVGIIVSSTAALGLLPYNLITRYAYQVGALFEILVLSFALAYKIKREQQDKILAQVQLIEAEQSMRENLEKLVQDRTTALEAANEKLLHISNTDGLTGIPNRRFFDERLRSEWRRHQRSSQEISLIMCDIDFFKAYNDILGHVKGDECIIKVAMMIEGCLDRSFDIIARYGGEEFAIILPDTDSKGAMALADTIKNQMHALAIEHPHKETTGHVSLSMGVATVIPGLNMPLTSLINLADKALYSSKANGRDCITLAS